MTQTTPFLRGLSRVCSKEAAAHYDGGRLSSVIDLSMKEGNAKRYEADGTIGIVFSSLTVQGPLARDRASFIVSARRTYIDVLARPFLNVDLGEQDARLIAFPDLVDGSISIESTTKFHAYEILLRRPASNAFGARSDWLRSSRRMHS